MQAQSMLEANFGMRILNKGDVIHNRQYTFTGLPEVYDRVMMDVAGAARTPVAKLFGRSAAGLNATGENDIRNYYDYIDGLRENYFREIIEKLLPIIALSCWGEIPDDLDIDFPPMEEANPEEIANITQKQTNAIMSAYQSNLIDAATAMRELQALSDTVGTFGKIKDEDVEKSEGITFSQSQMMRDPMSGLI
jgi:phage-related protein (TIGR01555 family)